METYLQNLTNLGENTYPENFTFTEGFNITNIKIRTVKVVKADRLYQVPPALVTMLFIAYGAIFFRALLGNGLVLWLIVLSKRMWTVTNLFIANLALADIIIAIFTVPFHFQAALFQRWDVPHFLCPICPFVQEFSVTVSVLTLAVIAVPRYGAVLHPLQIKLYKSKAPLSVLLIWLLAFAVALPIYLDFTVVTYHNADFTEFTPFCKSDWLSKSFKWYYYQFLVCVQYLVPLVIISIAYFITVRSLWNMQTPGNNEQARDQIILRNKKKVTRMMATVVLLFSICWLPYQTYKFLEIRWPKINNFYYINVVWFGMHWLAMSNSCVNPFIYAIHNEKFQEEFRRRWSTCWSRIRVLGNRFFIAAPSVVNMENQGGVVEVNLMNLRNGQVGA